MEFQANAERGGHGLPRMVVRCVADAAAGKTTSPAAIVRLKVAARRAVVTQIFDPAQAQPALAEHFGNLWRSVCPGVCRTEFRRR
jgi:hypothetical protein